MASMAALPVHRRILFEKEERESQAIINNAEIRKGKRPEQSARDNIDLDTKAASAEGFCGPYPLGLKGREEFVFVGFHTNEQFNAHISFLCSSAEHVAFRFQINACKRAAARNARVGGTWGQEELDTPKGRYPFLDREPFRITVLVTQNHFQLKVESGGGAHSLPGFRHRAPLSAIRNIVCAGGIRTAKLADTDLFRGMKQSTTKREKNLFELEDEIRGMTKSNSNRRVLAFGNAGPAATSAAYDLALVRARRRLQKRSTPESFAGGFGPMAGPAAASAMETMERCHGNSGPRLRSTLKKDARLTAGRWIK